MNAKKIYRALAILLGYGLIIACFILFGQSLEKNVRILDIIITCLVFTQFAMFTIFPLVNLNNPVQKEVGMLGIHLVTINIFSLLALGWMICGMLLQIPFKYQLIGQLVILFILFIGRYATFRSGEKVQQIYEKEQNVMEGKVSLRIVMDNLMDYMATVKDLDSSILQRLQSLHEAIRFITPSDSNEAKNFDRQFVQSVEDLIVLVRNTSMNKERIEEEVGRLERILARRKKY